MNILAALRNTTKGRLQYDGLWYKEGALEEVLSECTSPPSIPAPPQPRTATTTPDRSLPVSGLSLTDAEEEQYRQKLNSFHEQNEEELEKENSRNNSFSSPSRKEEKDRLNRSQHEESPVPPDDELLRPRVTASQTEDLLIPKVTEVDHALNEYERNVQNTVRRSLDERRQLFETASATFGLEAESALVDLYGRKEREAQRQLAAALAEQRARSAEQLRYEQQCKERNQEHAKLLDTRLREAQARKRQQEEEEENIRRQEIIDQLETLSKIQLELKTMATNSVRTITGCPCPQYLSENTKKASQILAQIIQRLDTIKQAHTAAPSNQHILDALELTKKAKGCHDIIEKGVEAATKQGKAEAEAAAKAKAAAEAAAPAASTATAGSAVTAGKTVSANADEVLCVDEQSFVRYQKLQERLKALQDSYGALTADPNLKKYKFDLQKAVNTPVNAIAPTSGSHLRDKLQRLVTLLQGGQLEVGGKRVSANDHPTGRTFVQDLFARKIIKRYLSSRKSEKQGEEQVASNHESAFAIAAVTVGVWCEVPEVGDSLLAHLHQRCPYTVPYYLPKKEGQSSDDYYKSLGYLFIDGTVEAQDKFLKRMSGIMRLYASILVSTPPRGSSQTHPHGIEHAWRWLASSLNLHPRPDITATMTFDLLEVTGHALFAAYRGQFVKLLQLLCTEFLPKVKQVTPAGSGGPVVRLENFLQKCIKSSAVARPAGMLSNNFWHT